MLVIFDMGHFLVPASAALAAIVVLLRRGALIADCLTLVKDAACGWPCLRGRAVNHGRAHADREIRRHNATLLDELHQDLNFARWQPMLYPRR